MRHRRAADGLLQRRAAMSRIARAFEGFCSLNAQFLICALGVFTRFASAADNLP